MRRELFTSVNTKAERIFDIQSTYTISQCFQTQPGCWNEKPNWKKKAGRRADDHYTDSSECTVRLEYSTQIVLSFFAVIYSLDESML